MFNLKTENGKHIVKVNGDVWEFNNIGEAMRFVRIRHTI